MPAEGGPNNGRVLVVDDEPQIRTACQQALERSGYQVEVAADGAGALRHLEAGPFDVAVLDIVLPDLNGLELLRTLREHDPDLVVVLITGFASLDTAMEAVRLGAYEYLRKPFRVQDLVRIVERGLESRRLRGRNSTLLEELQRANEELLRRQEQLHERMRMAADELAAFVDLGRRLGEGGSPTDLLHAILQAGVRVARARAAAAYRLEPDDGRLRGLIGVGLPAADVADARLSLGQGLLGRVAARGVPLIENDVLAGPIADDEYLGFLGVQSVLAAPLVRDHEVLGVLALFDNEDGGFSEQSLNLVRLLAEQAARVIAVAGDEAGVEAPPGSAEFVDLADLL